MKLKAVFLNCTLKTGEEKSNTRALIDEMVKIFDEEKVQSEIIRLADYQVSFGITPDAGDGDEWPKVFRKILEADILVFGTPIWLGEKSSMATLAMERLYGASSWTNSKGQYIYYNKVGGALITGNEDGAKQSASSILYGLSHIGFTVPPNVDAYWVGEAGPGPSFIEAEGYKNDFTRKNTKIMAYNLIHFARLLKSNPIPAEGNVVKSE